VLAGEPGAGKSRLAAEWLTDVALSGGHVGVGRVPPGGQMDGAVLRDAVTDGLSTLDPDRLRLLIGPRAAEVARVLPALQQRPASNPAPRLTLEDEQRRRTSLLCALVRDLAQDQPVVLLLDDFQWADVESIALVRRVVADSHQAPVMLLATVRPEALRDEHDVQRLLAALPADQVLVLRLAGLDQAATAELLGQVCGAAQVPADLAATIHRATEGNALFASELAHVWLRSGRLRVEQESLVLHAEIGEGSTGAALPTLRDILTYRLAAPGAAARALLERMAVMGHAVDLLLLSDASGLGPTVVLGLLDELLADRLLVVLGRDNYALAHPLIGDVALAEMPLERRHELHAQIAEALLRSGRADLEARVASHWSAAGIASRALPAHLAAGAAGLGHYNVTAALSQFEAAIDLLEQGTPASAEVSTAAYLGRARALAASERTDQALDDFRTAATCTSDPTQLAEISLHQAGLLNHTGRCQQALEMAADGLQHASAPKQEGRLRRERAMAWTRLGNYDEARVEADRALQLLADEPAGLAAVHHVLGGLAMDATADWRTAIDQFGRAGVLYAQVGNRRLAGRMASNIGAAISLAGAVADSRDWLERAVRLMHGDPVLPIAIAGLGWACRDLGDLAQALEWSLEALRVMQQGDDQVSHLSVLSDLGQIYADIGAPDKGLGFLERAWSEWQRGPIMGHELQIRARLALAHLQLDDVSIAEDWLDTDPTPEDGWRGQGEFHVARAGLAAAHNDAQLMETECQLAEEVYTRLSARAHIPHLYLAWATYREQLHLPEDGRDLRTEAARLRAELHQPSDLIAPGSGASELARVLDNYTLKTGALSG
jgi:tetratricopeptide (TPR) repeat protein